MKPILKFIIGAAAIGGLGFLSYKAFFANASTGDKKNKKLSPLDEDLANTMGGGTPGEILNKGINSLIPPIKTGTPAPKVSGQGSSSSFRHEQSLFGNGPAMILKDPKNGYVTDNVVASVDTNDFVGLYLYDYVMRTSGYADDKDWVAVKSNLGKDNGQTRYIRKSMVKTTGKSLSADGGEMINAGGSASEMINCGGSYDNLINLINADGYGNSEWQMADGGGWESADGARKMKGRSFPEYVFVKSSHPFSIVGKGKEVASYHNDITFKKGESVYGHVVKTNIPKMGEVLEYSPNTYVKLSDVKLISKRNADGEWMGASNCVDAYGLGCNFNHSGAGTGTVGCNGTCKQNPAALAGHVGGPSQGHVNMKKFIGSDGDWMGAANCVDAAGLGCNFNKMGAGTGTVSCEGHCNENPAAFNNNENINGLLFLGPGYGYGYGYGPYSGGRHRGGHPHPHGPRH
jgi:hypothetical protein